MTAQPFLPLHTHAVRLIRDDIDTDQIIPARFLKTTTRDGLGRHLFSDWRYDEGGVPRPDFPLNAVDPSTTQLLVAGRNFGCGSSREHAPWALRDWGLRAVIATSFADIFRNNAHKNGLLTIALSDLEHAQLLQRLEREPHAQMKVDLERQTVFAETSEPFRASFDIDPFSKRCLLDGVDELGYVLARADDITAYERGMPPLVPTNVMPMVNRTAEAR